MGSSQKFISGSLIAALTVSAIPMRGLAQSPTAESKGSSSQGPQLQYPELQVTPLASQRLEMEMKKEKSEAWVTHLPIQISAVSTIAAAASLLSEDKAQFAAEKKDQADYAALTGFVVGAGWIGLTTAMAMRYQPYTDGHGEVSAMASGSRKDVLTRERMAEEAIDRAASVGRRLTWLSVLTNLAATGFVMSSSENNGTKAIAGLAAATAFAPVIFPYRWQSVSKQHDLYKKRIYAPIVSSGWQVRDGEAAPMVFAHLIF